MMTRKDYVAFVNTFGDFFRAKFVGEQHGKQAAQFYVLGWDTLMTAVVKVLADDNPRFDADRFFEALEYRISTGHLVRVGQRNFDHNPFKCKLCMERVGYNTKGVKLKQDNLPEEEKYEGTGRYLISKMEGGE